MNAVFWVAITATLLSSAWWVLVASARDQAGEGDRADLDVYADQVVEIDRDLSQGRISQAAADAGRLEIGRRLVKARDRVLSKGPRANGIVLGAIAGAIALLAGGLYAIYGSPGRADVPFVARERELLARDPGTLTQDEILLLLQERARANPSDPMPHALMGQVLVGAGRDQDAMRAFQAVLRRSPNDSEAIAEAAGILTRLNGGVIGADARQAFDGALKINPNSASARYYLALADWQKGQKDVAMKAWASAYQNLSDKPEAQDILAARVTTAVSQLDVGPPSDAAAGNRVRPMAGMNGADQAAFISSMIDTRRARLAANPNDVALRLSVVRVLIMTGQTQAARTMLLEGVERAGDKGFEIALYGVAARSLIAGAATPAQPVTKR